MTSNAAKSRKPRSPAAPSRNLRDALDDVRRLYETYSHGTFSRAEIASTLGVSAGSGPFSSRFFTLKEFGLIEGSGESLIVSTAFKEMNGASQDSAVFKRRALGAIRRSEVFRSLLDEWKTKLPPRDAVAKRLEDQMKFNADRAKAAAGILEESLRHAGVLDSSNNILPVRDDSGQRDEGSAQAEHGDGQSLGDEEPSTGTLRTEIPVGGARRVVVVYPEDLTAEEAGKVGNVLKAIVG